MKKIILVLLSLFTFNGSYAKSPGHVLEFSIDRKVVLSVESVTHVKLSTETDLPEDSAIKKIWDIGFAMNPADAEKFKKITENNIGQQMVISMNGKKLTSVHINVGIPNGLVQITNPSEKEAKHNFKMLKSLEAKK
jgi:preprotein translocase subunit SecD